jgi:RNA recognition motif-containing protein
MSKKLFVGNLPDTTSERDLYFLFRNFGATTAKIPLDDKGYSRGFGFVRVDEAKVTDAIRIMDGMVVEGRQLTVEEAQRHHEEGRGSYRQ